MGGCGEICGVEDKVVFKLMTGRHDEGIFRKDVTGPTWNFGIIIKSGCYVRDLLGRGTWKL